MFFRWKKGNRKHALNGQTIIEVIIAAGIVALVLTAVVAAVTTSVKNTALAKSKNLATKYSQEGMEFFRNQRASVGWEAFVSFFQTVGTSFCLQSIPSSITQLTAGTCTASQFVDSNDVFQRSAAITLTSSSGTVTNVQVVITVTWADGNVTKTSSVTQNFQQWSITDAGTVKVLAGTNLALGKPAIESSVLSGTTAIATRAVDGSTDGNWADNSVTHTNQDVTAWWQVDLGVNAYIGTISIWNRLDCCAQRLTNFDVFVSPNPFTSTNLTATQSQNGVVWQNFPGQGGYPTTLTFNTYGRYVRVQLVGTDYLSLAEVQVFAGTPP